MQSHKYTKKKSKTYEICFYKLFLFYFLQIILFLVFILLLFITFYLTKN